MTMIQKIDNHYSLMEACDEIYLDPAYWGVTDFIDSKVGILKEIYRCRMYGLCPKTFMYLGKLCNSNILFPDRVRGNACEWSTGINIDQKSAILGCIFEGIERYCSSVIPTETLLWGTEQDILNQGLECMRSSMFDYFTDAQYSKDDFGYKKWTVFSQFRWSCCKSLTTNKDFYIPAQFIFVPYKFMRNEAMLYDQMSTGLAAQRTLQKAIYLGLYEVVERDAFMIFWYNMLRSPHLKPEDIYGINPQINLLLDRIYEIPNLELIIMDITTDINIPTILCILRNKLNKNAPAAAFAAATGLDPIMTLQKALNELLGTYIFACILQNERVEYQNMKVGPSEWNKIYSLEDHVALHAQQEILEYISWVDEGPIISLSDLISKYENGCGVNLQNEDCILNECVNRLKSSDLEAFYVDVTTEDINASGFKVVKVCIPGCVPLHSPHINRPMGCKRLYSESSAPGIDRQSKINIIPHPYP